VAIAVAVAAVGPHRRFPRRWPRQGHEVLMESPSAGIAVASGTTVHITVDSGTHAAW